MKDGDLQTFGLEKLIVWLSKKGNIGMTHVTELDSEFPLHRGYTDRREVGSIFEVRYSFDIQCVKLVRYSSSKFI